MSTESDAPEAGPTTSTKAILVSIAAAVGGFLFGFDSSVINGAVKAINRNFDLDPHPFLAGFAVACALLGSAVGAWFAGPIADKYGRVRVMLVAAALFAISAIGSGLAFSVADLIVWRILAGVGIGAASVIAPAYIAEVAPAHIRGRLGSLQQMAIVLGIFVAILSDALFEAGARAPGGAGGSGAYTEFWLGLQAWRWMFLVGVIPAVIYAILALRIPESPRYLVARGELEHAGRVLASVEGARSPESVRAKIDEIAESLRREEKPSLRDLRGDAAGLKPIVWVGILLSVFQQFVGINVIFYYSTSLWTAAGFANNSFLFSVINSAVNVVSTVVAILIVDKVGRKPMLLGGSIGMTITLGLMAIAFSQSTQQFDPDQGKLVPILNPGWGPVALIAANLFVVAFAVSWGPVVWVLLGEMFPNYLRAAALAVAAAAQWIANFIITETFQPLADVSLTLAYAIYTLFALLSGLFVWRYVKETKGKELEDMVA